MLILQRYPINSEGNFGILFNNDGSKICFTCELPWLNNMPEISCIPTGLYNVVPYSSPLHNDVWQITDVPNRSAILIHPGNTVDDTHGCICVGAAIGKINNKLAVLNSQMTFAMLKQLFPANFQLTIQ